MSESPLKAALYTDTRSGSWEKCLPSQRIHLHCFSGDEELVKTWMEAFPNTYFSLSGLICSSPRETREAVRSIPGDRLLLETDSPHLAIDREARYNTPSYLADIGQMVASIREQPLSDIMERTCSNALRLYGP